MVLGSHFKIKKGLNLPIKGAAPQTPIISRPTKQVAVLGPDYLGMKPTMVVKEGDQVAAGSLLFTDKKTDGVRYTSPVDGQVAEIRRGAKRALLGVIIDVSEDYTSKAERLRSLGDLDALSEEAAKDKLLESGLWTALRTRPFSRVPDPQTKPNSIFVTALDTNPLATDPEPIMLARLDELKVGLHVLSLLTEGNVNLCLAPSSKLLDKLDDQPTVVSHQFEGIHPAGLPGTHIHFIDPVSASKTVWYLGYQDVIAIGHLFLTDRIDSERVISLAGPGAKEPKVLKTYVGASLSELADGELIDGEQRLISGSVLSGRAAGEGAPFLGRYHLQVSILPENRERKLIGWFRPGFKQHSVFPTYISKWLGEKDVDFTTAMGSPRAIVPIGMFDQVMPMDILATPLMKSLVVGDVERAIELGCLELDEEDISLCTYACPGKHEYGPVLRELLTNIEKEG